MRTLLSALALVLLLPAVATAKGPPSTKATVFYFDSHIRATCDYRTDDDAKWVSYRLSMQNQPSSFYHDFLTIRVAVGEYQVGQRIFDAYGTHDGQPTTYKFTCELTDANGERVAYSEHYYKFNPVNP